MDRSRRRHPGNYSAWNLYSVGISRRLSAPHLVSSITGTGTHSFWTYRVQAANTIFIGAVCPEIPGETFQDE